MKIISNILTLVFYLFSIQSALMAQIDSTLLDIRYDDVSCSFDIYMVVTHGETGNGNLHRRFSQGRITLVTDVNFSNPSITSYEPRSETSPLPWGVAGPILYDNKKYWNFGFSGSGLVPELYTYSELKLFSVQFNTGNPSEVECIEDRIRFYNATIDPGSAELPQGTDLAHSVQFAFPRNTYNGHFSLITSKPTLQTSFDQTTDLIIDLSVSGSICANSYTYQWDGPSYTETTEDVLRSPYEPANHDGMYYVTVTDGLGCTSSTSLKVMGPLPVEYRYIDVNATGSSTVIIWETTAEINCHSFEIQRSVDGKDFQTIGKSDCKSENGAAYRFVDKDLSSGTYYYRLLQKDIDGQQDKSDVHSITIAHQSLLQKIGDDIFISDEVSEVRIYSMQGALLSRHMNPSHSVNLDHLDHGVYVVSALYPGGSKNLKVSR